MKLFFIITAYVCDLYSQDLHILTFIISLSLNWYYFTHSLYLICNSLYTHISSIMLTYLSIRLSSRIILFIMPKISPFGLDDNLFGVWLPPPPPLVDTYKQHSSSNTKLLCPLWNQMLIQVAPENAQNWVMAMEKFKNQSHWIEVVLDLDWRSHCKLPNNIKDTSIQVHIWNLWPVKVLVKLGPMASTNEEKIWNLPAHGF